MNTNRNINHSKVIIIGGSAGSFHIVIDILKKIPLHFQTPVILVLHRLKDVKYGFIEALSVYSKKEIVEPINKENIVRGKIYLAPSNYHLVVESDFRFSLSTKPEVNFSKPSIDVLFQSASQVYEKNLTGILLSGANEDGAAGMQSIKRNGGFTIVQNPKDCKVDTMPLEALKLIKPDYLLNPEEIVNYLMQY